MKKRILILLVIAGSLMLSGCGKYNEKDLVKDLTKKIENVKSYSLTGELEMINNEDIYTYAVEVGYKKEDKFRVSLKNKVNNHEQIILKNKEGVYVLTPSLNKSFKFQSEWPYNNSQSYLLHNILEDIKNDKDKKFVSNDDGYVLTVKANYSSNKKLEKQKIFIDKKLNIKELHVLNKEEQVLIKMKFDKIDLNAKLDDKLFELKDNMETAKVEEEVKLVSKINDIIYPMYMPINTRLESQDRVNKEVGERIISTFSGENPFMLIQETVEVNDEMVTIPVTGEPVILSGTVGALSETSITWSSEGISYYLLSEVVKTDELLNIAKSISVMPVGK